MEHKEELEATLFYVSICFFAWIFIVVATWLFVDATYMRAFERGVKSVERARVMSVKTTETEETK